MQARHADVSLSGKSPACQSLGGAGSGAIPGLFSLHPIGDGGQLARLSQPVAIATKRARTPPAAAAIAALTHSFMPSPYAPPPPRPIFAIKRPSLQRAVSLPSHAAFAA